MPTVDKKLLIDLAPIVAVAILVAGYFIPVPIGQRALLGFILGLIGRAIFPFYMRWKAGEEELIFNYAYLMPIATLVAAAVFAGISGFTEYVTLITSDAPDYIIYAGAIIFAYGGVAMFDGFKKWTAFLDDIWRAAQTFEPSSIEPDDSGAVVADEPEKEPTPLSGGMV